tara:strand:+ start:5633 stop:7312 length:1680 start_codon:yes stop_codon:yes gene_type:complete
VKSNRLILPGIFCCFLLVQCTFSKNKNVEPILAEIDGYTVSEAHFLTSFKELYYRTGQSIAPDPSTKKAVLDSEFNTYVLAVHAIDQGLDMREELEFLKTRIQARVVTEEFKRQLLFSDLEVTESTLREYFVRFNTKVRASHLYAKTREESELLLARIQAGESFDDLAKEVFETRYLQDNGGDVGFFTTDDMDVSFEEAAFTNSPGSIVGPIQTAQGFSIIKVTDRIQNPILTEADFQRQLPELEQYARKKLQELHERRHLEDFIESVTIDKIFIKILLKDLNSKQGREQGIEGINPKNWMLDEPILRHRYGILTLKDWESEWRITPVEYLEGISSVYHLKSVLSGIAYRSYISHLAHEAGIPSQPEVQASIKQTYLNSLALEVEKGIKRSIEFSPAELYTTFEANPDRFIQPKQVLLQRIVVSSKEKAQQIYAVLQQGHSFTDMLQLHTESNEDLMVDGVMNYQQWAQLGHLGEELQRLALDYVTKPVAYQANEYHIYKCLDIEEARSLRFDEAKEAVKNILLEQKFRAARSELIRQVKKKHNAFIDLERLEEINIEI